MAATGGVGIVVGLATYGYKIIRVLGVKMVHLTFSRGFAVELGAAIVIIVASRYGLPVSSTQVSRPGSTALLSGLQCMLEPFAASVPACLTSMLPSDELQRLQDIGQALSKLHSRNSAWLHLAASVKAVPQAGGVCRP